MSGWRVFSAEGDTCRLQGPPKDSRSDPQVDPVADEVCPCGSGEARTAFCGR